MSKEDGCLLLLNKLLSIEAVRRLHYPKHKSKDLHYWLYESPFLSPRHSNQKFSLSNFTQYIELFFKKMDLSFDLQLVRK